MPSTLSDDPLLFGLEMSLSNTLKIALFHSNNYFLKFFLKQKIHKCMTPKWFKIRTTQIIRGSSFFFNIKPPARYIHINNILTAFITTPSPLPTHSFSHSTVMTKTKYLLLSAGT